MAKAKSYLPEGTRTLTPHLTVKGANQAIEFYQKAFGATLNSSLPDPKGTIVHAEVKIGDSIFFLNDEVLEMGAKGPFTIGGSPVTIHLFVPDCDATYNQAVAAGAQPILPLADQFWGDRYGQVKDPFGHLWAIATHQEELTPAEIGERAKHAMAQMARK